MKANRLALTVFLKMRASHSLAGFETPHFHLWKIAAEFQGELPLKSDRLVDLVFLQDELGKILLPYENTFLNDTLGISPTSENLAQLLWSKITAKISDAPLHAITVTLNSLEGEPMGEARIFEAS